MTDVSDIIKRLTEPRARDVLYASDVALMLQAASALSSLKEENERLREALKSIASCEQRFVGDVVSVARAALHRDTET